MLGNRLDCHVGSGYYLPAKWNSTMCEIIKFPLARAVSMGSYFAQDEPAKIIILPVIRIERDPDEELIAAMEWRFRQFREDWHGR